MFRMHAIKAMLWHRSAMAARPAMNAMIAVSAVTARTALVVAIILGGFTANAGAADFRSVGVAAAVLYDGPSAKGRKLFVAPRGMPLEVLSVVNNWVKVRDAAGDVLWIERAELSPQRTLVATTTAQVRASPQDTAAVVFQAERGVLLELTDPAVTGGWAKVRHRDGSIGFVKAGEVWGL